MYNGHNIMYLLIFFFSHAVLLSLGSCGSENLTPINNGCVCPGGMLQFNCTAVGIGITTWTGTAFAQAGCSPTSISLNHNQFQEFINDGALRFCPDTSPAINITSLSIVDSCYTSQLTIPSLSAEYNGLTISCQHDTTQNLITNIGTHTIMFTTGKREGGRERERERGGGGGRGRDREIETCFCLHFIETFPSTN
jgi:hypothetical protein